MEWISVKEKEPPKDGTPFLGYDPEKEHYEKTYVLIYDDYLRPCYREASGECYFEWNPTHWMPLPSPPKE